MSVDFAVCPAGDRCTCEVRQWRRNHDLHVFLLGSEHGGQRTILLFRYFLVYGHGHPLFHAGRHHHVLSGITRRIVDFASALIDFVTGALGCVSMLACMFFGAATASSGAAHLPSGGELIHSEARCEFLLRRHSGVPSRRYRGAHHSALPCPLCSTELQPKPPCLISSSGIIPAL